jgi:hypothetical protein
MSDIVDIGELPNDGTGDPLRVAFDKINLNFANLALLAPNGPNSSFQFKNGNYYLGTENLVYDSANNNINIGSNLIPLDSTAIAIGSNTNKIDKLYLDQDSLRIGNITVKEDGNTLSFPISVLPSQNASFNMNNLNADGNVTVGGVLNLANASIATFKITTINDTANQVIYQIPAIDFNSGTFKITSREAASNNSQSVTLSVSKRTNNLTASFSAHSTVFIGVPVTRYNVDVGYGNLRVMVSPIPSISMEHTVSYEIQQ